MRHQVVDIKFLTPEQNRCCVGLCEKPIESKGLCSAHAKRWRRHGRLYKATAAGAIPGLVRTREQAQRDYYLQHREERLAYQKARREADVEKARAYEREVRARRAAQHRADARARERKLGTLGADSLLYDAILRRDPCSYCGGPADQVDHIEPVAHDGPNHWTNLTAACRSCNRAKSDKSLLEHLAGAGR